MHLRKPLAAPIFTNHAIQMFVKRARFLSLNESLDHLRKIYELSHPEQRSRNKIRRWHLFVRQIINHTEAYRVYQGWRFIIKEGKVITVERVKASENVVPHHVAQRLALTANMPIPTN